MAKTTKKSEKSSIMCPICLEPIKDAIGNRKGKDSIYCDGPVSAMPGCIGDVRVY